MNFPANSAMQRVRVIVSGHVQGVGFRYFVKESAESLQLTGWVRNMTNGNVELLAEGDQETLQTFVNRVRQGNAMS
ncbi:MAG TPA: acylphosphatase, partial [Anaerolineaceae bacterium]|nr:acylphosphatase [Anaerolineaceae bacterium]